MEQHPNTDDCIESPPTEKILPTEAPIRTESSPLIPSEIKYPELTLKSVLLTIILSCILTCANIYLGLFAGQSISVSIPSSILAMVLLKPFKTNVLEVNCVQTGASAGASLSAGVIYTVPALIILGIWKSVDYVPTTAITALGGLLGVLFSVPLRRVLIVDKPLRFPEGVATAEVLKFGTGKDVKNVGLLTSGITGAVIGLVNKWCTTGFLLWNPIVKVVKVFNGIPLYGALNLSPALLAVGYILKLRVCLVLFFGAVMNYWVAIPIIASVLRNDNWTGDRIVSNIFNQHTRYIGVGAMLLGGVATLIKLFPSLIKSLGFAIRSFQSSGTSDVPVVRRTEKDIPFSYLIGGVFVVLVPLFIVVLMFTQRNILVTIVMLIFMVVGGFVFSAVGAYLAGIVGSSNNPISGVTVATICTAALLLVLMLGRNSTLGVSASILIGAVVCVSAAIAGDNMQDLKAGYILGSTPYKQQIMQMIGLIAPSFLVAPVINLLINAYGIGERRPEFPNPLPAPQANLMASVTQSIFHGGLNYTMLGIGLGFAAVVFLFNEIFLERLLKNKTNFRMPVMAAAIGFYLPFELSTAVLIGGFIAWFSEIFINIILRSEEQKQAIKEDCERQGILFAAGTITGESLAGILVAIPIVISGKKDIMAFLGVQEHPYPGIGLIAILIIIFFILNISKAVIFKWKKKRRKRDELPTTV